MRTAESLGPTAQKLLVLLLGGLALSLTTSPRRYFRIIRTIKKDFGKINQRALHNAIRNLYKAKLIDGKDNSDGTTTLFLTEKGRVKTLRYKIDDISIPEMKRWDGKWRVILFDIPEKYKKSRNALARSLKNMGFYQFQKSVFIHPFECKNEIDFVIEFFSLRPHVRMIMAERVDTEPHLKRIFDL